MTLTEDAARVLLAARGFDVPADELVELLSPMNTLLQQAADLAAVLETLDTDSHCGHTA